MKEAIATAAAPSTIIFSSFKVFDICNAISCSLTKHVLSIYLLHKS